MARDYVKKGKPVPRKNTRQQQPAPKKTKNIVLLLLVVILIGAFISFLISIQGKAPEQKTIEPVNSSKESPLPKMPEEKWEYVKELENKTIEVDVPKRDDKPTRPYQMQCGSFRVEGQANTMKAKIAFAGLESMVKKTNGSNGVWYRVVLGPYPTKREAEADRHKLQRAKVNGCQIWFWT
ncbi:SPOR domain-containing protein [Catenovulum adriaticum]|uniref:SPOR domain-containing protein n=1 Tax=Catenovulum adriaticum TaxID=2984846 RepID=A0ABY7ALW4_9ALTE|nr:SPOR domain-containing protein [Catenovulum sp. TS8]WAJ69460.1 SPOR domain-containing protein [Catenovulum sp. TS8]